jgi:hypothetical protein
MSVALGLATALLAGCETPLGPPEISGGTLSGEWVACLNEGGADQSRTIVFYSDSFASTTRTFATTDGTCGGAETASAREPWRYRLADPISAQLGPSGASVAARELNVENSFETVFTIVYVDEASDPRVLYLGDLAFDPLQDGSAPERRPAVLSASPIFTSR